MDAQLARTLVSPEGREALEAARAYADPTSLAAATAMRKAYPPELAAGALAQESLRRKAVAKFGDAARDLFFTPAGLEQATRPAVAHWRAEALAATGVRRVADLGCGLGTDAAAFRDAGLGVRAVELDEATAILAKANLGDDVEVVTGRAEDVDLADDEAAYCDPARRNDRGRLWRAEDFTPGWDFVLSLLARDAGACVKLGPALPHRMVPDGVGARWLSDHGDVVEVSLWSKGFEGFGAVLLPAGVEVGGLRLAGARSADVGEGGLRLAGARSANVGEGARSADVEGGARSANVEEGARSANVAEGARSAVGPLGAFVFEPDGAVIRSGVLDQVAADLGLRRIDPGIAYLTGDAPVASPLVTTFAVREVLPYKEKALRRWVADHGVGTLEIKKRGIDVDPAVLRKRLKPAGSNSATLILTPTAAGAMAIVAERLREPTTGSLGSG
ncbi:class I SAM-dependent methyltransferase [Mariniluteicoccus flavus]